MAILNIFTFIGIIAAAISGALLGAKKNKVTGEQHKTPAIFAI